MEEEKGIVENNFHNSVTLKDRKSIYSNIKVCLIDLESSVC